VAQGIVIAARLGRAGGAILCTPSDAANTCGVIFFNTSAISACAATAIGLVATLSLGRVQPGDHRIETSVGTVTATLHADGTVTVANVPSFRHATKVSVNIPGHGVVHGDGVGRQLVLSVQRPWLALEARWRAFRIRVARARR
jgi:proline racemase